MPQRKKSYKFFGICDALNFHPEVRKFSLKHPGVFRGKDEFLTLGETACFPDSFSFYDFRHGRHLPEAFWKIYVRQPDDVLAFLCVVRKILNKWNKTQAGTVIQYLCKNELVQVEDREAEHDASGNRIAVIVKNKLDNREERIPVSHLSDDKANGILFPKCVHVGSLLDKELATLLKVNTDSVKKARQELSRIGYEIEFWNHPATVNYMKTGVVTPELKRLRKAYSKGKK